ncbi:MAG: DUF4412 domain-containing protein [Bacteroidota bacterium]|nr:DUF4412 domain-containing protein [Bacteroidota bacterium]
MQHAKSLPAIILSACLLLACSCNNQDSTAEKNNPTQPSANDRSPATTSSTALQGNDRASDTTVKSGDASTVVQNTNTDSMLAQMQSLSSMFGKGDSGNLKNLGGGSSMDNMMKKMQSMMGGKNGNPGDAIANSVLNLQLGQMKDNNPLKSVAKGMMEAQKNGTAGPSKTYTATYAPEQPVDYKVPVSGNGNTIMLQYTGGTVANNKKDGLWKNLYISITGANKWNVYSEGCAESSAINMKVHSTSLASINETYAIILNDQYKKYSKQQRNDFGKNESGVQVQKIGMERMFGYNCVHIKVTYTLKALGETAHEQDDEWYSTDAPGSQFLSSIVFENHSPDVVKQIINAGCSGALIKSVTRSSGSSSVIQLSSIAQNNMPDSMFNLPADYQEDKNTALYGIQ